MEGKKELFDQGLASELRSEKLRAEIVLVKNELLSCRRVVVARTVDSATSPIDPLPK
jgi:hypothetical protein